MRIAIVTGSNKGIGYEAVKLLVKKLKGTVYLTSRDEKRGHEAVEVLKKEGFDVNYHQLDITDINSCIRFRDDMKSQHGGIDILINNAGIAFKHDATDPLGVQAETTLGTNYFATKQFCQIVFPILNKNARVVNVSSLLGHLSILNTGKKPESSHLQTALANPSISYEELDKLANDFITHAKNGTVSSSGWISSTYSVSKVLVSVLTRIQQKEMDEQRPEDNILVNAVHPGYVITDMTSNKGNFTPERGCQSMVWAALIPEDKNEPCGEYIWHDNRVVDFTASSYPRD